MRRCLLLLVVLLPLGCRDGLTDPPLAYTPGSPDEHHDPIPDVDPPRHIYLKGPLVMTVGRTYAFRGEPRADIATYHWDWAGEGYVESDSPRETRFFTVRATGRGNVMVFIRGYNADGALIAEGSRRVAIQ